MSFKAAVLNTPVEARTTNGMKALESSLSVSTDLFFQIGASRGKIITPHFERAYQEDREVALRIVQWARDVRGGAGERELFRQVLKYLEKNHKNDLLNTRILRNVSEIGRWDDLLIFEDVEVRNIAFTLIKEALDTENGLCAKWMPRKGIVAAELRKFLGWSPKFYRKRLVSLASVVETKMCAKEWDSINFSHVPSLASARYTNAFNKNAPVTYAAYKASLEKGDESVKINAGAVYPYDVLKTCYRGDSAIADAQWKALPNYMGDAKVLPLVDVSGSMDCSIGAGTSNLTCLDVAVSLGLYCSDKNTGAFKDLFLTFTSTARFNHLKGTLSEKLHQMKRADWQGSTNLHAAFVNILKVAVDNNVAPEDMPETLLILSDMQFDYCVDNDHSAIEMIRYKYVKAGYKVPQVVFWNLNARDNVPVKFNEHGTALVSGFSPSILKAVLAADMEQFTPEGIMKAAISSDRYAL